MARPRSSASRFPTPTSRSATLVVARRRLGHRRFSPRSGPADGRCSRCSRCSSSRRSSRSICCCDWDRMIATVDGWIPLQHRDTVRGLAREIDNAIAGFVRGQAVVCLILGAFYAVGLDADRAELRVADRPDDRAAQLHSLCRRADRVPGRGRRRDRAVLAGLDVDPHGGRRFRRRPVPRRQCAVAQARRRQGRPASGLDDVRAARVRLSVRLRRPSGRGPARGDDRRAGCASRSANIWKARSTPGARLGRAERWRARAPCQQPASRRNSRSRSTMPKALRARISSPGRPTRRRSR